jgi:hypothetical protein
LKRENHSTRMLDGTPMRVYLIDMEDEEYWLGGQIILWKDLFVFKVKRTYQ